MKTKPLKFDLKILIVCSVLSIIILSTPTFAANIKPADGSASINKCVSQGELNFTTFLNSVIYSDGIREGVIEPWMDILSRNKCQSSDIYGLVAQRDKLRSIIRTSYLTCKEEKIPTLKNAFYKLNAEIYYVRHVVDGEIAVGLPYTSIKVKLKDDKDSFYADPNKLMEAMKTQYVGPDKITENQFPLFFENLEKKYAKRKVKYISCDEDLTFKSVGEKIDKSKKKIADETKKTYEQSKKQLGGRVEKLVEAVTDVAFKDQVEGMFKLNINKVTPKRALSEFLRNTKYLNAGPTKEDAVSHLYQETRTFDKETLRRELQAHFESLYRVVNDNSIEIMLEELVLTDIAIKDGTRSLADLLKCINRLDKKQCAKTK